MAPPFASGSKLVLFEGLPGSGKSTAAHHTMLALQDAEFEVVWNYEEELDHPVVLFNNKADLAEVIDAVFGGRHAEIITRSIERWTRFSKLLASGRALRLLDGQFFGGLGWTLHVADVPEKEIIAYFNRLIEVLEGCGLVFVWLSEPDVGVTFERLLTRGGSGYAKQQVERSLAYPYAKKRGFKGEAGARQLWADYQKLVEQFLATVRVPLIWLDSTEGVEVRDRVLFGKQSINPIFTRI